MDDEMGSVFDESVVEQQKSPLRSLVSVLLYMGVILLVTVGFIRFVGQRTIVIGNSMYPTLHEGESLMVDKLFYRLSGFKRFDIVVFLHDGAEEEYYIKRVIGLPGETVQIIDSVIYINGEPLEDPYRREPEIREPGLAAEPITLGADEYFCMGDNRNHSTDSRFASVGSVSREKFMGKVWLRIFPLNRIGLLK